MLKRYLAIIAVLAAAVHAHAAEDYCERGLIVVDGYFQTGRKIAPVAREKGFFGISVRSAEGFPEGAQASYRPQDFAFEIVHRGDNEATAKELIEKLDAYSRSLGLAQRLPLAGVIAGADTGVPQQDFLAHRFGLPGNSPDTTLQRVDKGLIGDALRRHGVRTVEQFEATSAVAAVGWAEQRKRWPILVKPPRSNGSDSIFICRSLSEIDAAFRKIFARPNQAGLINESVLLEDFVEGPQYAINTESFLRKLPSGDFETVRYVSDIWLQARKPPFPNYVYDHNLLLPFEGKVQESLREYNSAVLDALEDYVGPSHLEVILTEDGPIAIDPNLRLPGADMPTLVWLASGRNPISLAIDAQTGSMDIPSGGYNLQSYAAVVYVRSLGNARMSYRLKAKLDRLKDKGIIFNYKFNFPEGAPLGLSKDSDSIIAKIDLLNPNWGVIKRTINQIRRWERDHRFEN